MLVREDGGESLAEFVSLEFMSCQCFEGSSCQLAVWSSDPSLFELQYFVLDECCLNSVLSVVFFGKGNCSNSFRHRDSNPDRSGEGRVAEMNSEFRVFLKESHQASSLDPLQAREEASCFARCTVQGVLVEWLPAKVERMWEAGTSMTEWPRRWTRNPYIQASHACAPGSTPGGRICLAALGEGVPLNKEFAPIWKHPALVGWEE